MGFLLTLFLVHLKHFGTDYFNENELTCKLTVYFHYFFGFASPYFVVAFSIERVVTKKFSDYFYSFFTNFILKIAVYFPFRSVTVCSTTIRKKVIIFIVSFGLMFYSGNLIITGIGSSNSLSECSPIEKSVKFAQIMAITDTIVTMFVLYIIFVSL